jgi:hypothetical protein
MSGLLGRLERRRQHNSRIVLRRAAVGGGGFFTLAAVAFLASFSPFTFIPFLAAAVGLALLGAIFVAVTPLLEFFW